VKKGDIVVYGKYARHRDRDQKHHPHHCSWKRTSWCDRGL